MREIEIEAISIGRSNDRPTGEMNVEKSKTDLSSESEVASGLRDVEPGPLRVPAEIDDATSPPVAGVDVVSINETDGTSFIDRSPTIEGPCAPSRKLRRKPRVDRQRGKRQAPVVAAETRVVGDVAETSESDAADESGADVLTASTDGGLPSEGSVRHAGDARDGSSSAASETSTIEGRAKTSETSAESVPRAPKSERSTLDRAPAKGEEVVFEAARATAAGSSVEGQPRTARKRPKDSLKSSLGRKVESSIERILEENADRYPWLQPIEAWIADRCKHSSVAASYRLADAADRASRQDLASAAEAPTYDFKFTPATGENEEPRLEGRVIEHLRRLGGRTGVGGSRSYRVAPAVPATSAQNNGDDNASNASIVVDRGDILELKEVKRHDLLDKLKDNVKEKMEDIHRVAVNVNIVFLIHVYNICIPI